MLSRMRSKARAVSLSVGAFVGALLLVHCSDFGSEEAPGPVDGATGDAASETALADAEPDQARGACSANVATDPKHCGVCDHDCLGGTCMSGECQPFVLTGGLSNPAAIALGASSVFFEVGAGNGATRSLVRCPRSGCGTSGPELVLGGIDDVTSLLVVDSQLAFVTFDLTNGIHRIETCDLGTSSCLATRRTIEGPIANFFEVFTPLRRADPWIYWGQRVTTGGEIRRVRLDGRAPAEAVVPSTECSPRQMAVGPSDVTWTCANVVAIRRCGIPCTGDGGASVAEAKGVPDHLERTATHLIWDTATPSEIVIREDASGTMRTLVPRSAGAVAKVGDDIVFQSSLLEEISACTLPACASIKTLAKKTIAASIAADDKGVFWTVPSTNVVMGVAR